MVRRLIGSTYWLRDKWYKHMIAPQLPSTGTRMCQCVHTSMAECANAGNNATKVGHKVEVVRLPKLVQACRAKHVSTNLNQVGSTNCQPCEPVQACQVKKVFELRVRQQFCRPIEPLNHSSTICFETSGSTYVWTLASFNTLAGSRNI